MDVLLSAGISKQHFAYSTGTTSIQITYMTRSTSPNSKTTPKARLPLLWVDCELALLTSALLPLDPHSKCAPFPALLAQLSLLWGATLLME